MIKRFQMYLIFVVVGLVITGANLSIYLAIARSSSRNSITTGNHVLQVDVGSSASGGGGGDSGIAATSHHPHRQEKNHDDENPQHKHQKDPNSKKHGPSSHQRSEHQSSSGEGGEKPTTARPHHHHHQQQQPHHHQGKHEVTAAPPQHNSKHHSNKRKKEDTAKPSDRGNHKGDEEAATGATKKPPPKFKKHRGGYVAYDSNRTEYFNKTFDEALALYNAFLAEPLKDELEQSSRLFRDILERSDSGVKLPTSPAELAARFGIAPEDEGRPSGGSGNADGGSSATGGGASHNTSTKPFCDPLDADYTEESDELCQQYLRDIRNWQSIKPMSSILSSGRTIKFKVFYKHNDISAVLKVSQKKFALEPASEVVAFYVDRTLGFDRVPPVVWAPFPIPFLQAACASMDAFYAQWFEKFSLKYSSVQPLISNGCFPNGIKCVNVSLQLWLFDVHNAEDTILKPSQSYEKYLALPATDQAAVDRLKPGGSPADRTRIAYAELMDEFIFDLIIGNTDRWFGHNSFVLGGCERSCPPEGSDNRRKTKSTVRYAFIDQGSSFYRNGIPDMNPFLSHYEHLCRFRARTVETVLQASPADPSADSDQPFHERVKAKLPKGIFHLANRELVQSSTKRLALLAQHMRSCLGNYSKEDVMFF